MGNVPSSYFEEKIEDHFWSKCASTGNADAKSSTSQNLASATRNLSQTAPKVISEANKEKLSEFKLELARKHEKRRDIIAGKRMEMDTLRKEIEKLKKENEELKTHTSKEIYQDQEEIERLRRENEEIDNLRKENEELKCLLKEKSLMLEESERIIDKNRELRISIAELQTELQRLNKEVMNFEKEREDYRVHVVALKDVISVSKHMLQLRESQLKELKEKVESIEQSLASREATILSQDLRAEYEKQITNMRNLRLLYEERQRAERREREEIASQLAEANKELELQQKKNGEHETRINELELENSKKYDQIKALESSLGLSKAENRQYQAELAVINQLFSETLLKYNTSQEIDLDKLQKHLEEHHGLLKDIVVNEVSSEVSYALPKVLLELINQLHENEEIVNEEGIGDDNQSNKLHSDGDQESPNTATRHEMSSAEEIVENLPKVWRVLIELLSHQIVPTNTLTNDKDDEDEDPCYKRIETPKGPSLVLSVSQTFIRLKDLILEKKSLEKETANLKHLNCHLENRLQDQEKRLELVHNELSKTWLVVGKLQKQHQMLHTQEKILRYELAQKRKLLNELKEELEYSREKWAQAREKNSNTELQWRQLRTEFANRRNTTTEDNNNSAESGYSDDREGLSDEEPGYETDVSECAQKTGEDTENQDLEVEELSEDIANENLETTTENSNLERIEEQNANKNNSETSVESSSIGNIEAQNANKNNSETSVESSSLGNIEVQNANENPDDDHIVSSTSDIEKTSSTGNNTDEEEFTKVKSQTTSDLEDIEVQTSLGAHLETTTESSNLGNTTVQQPEDLCAVSSTSSIEQTSSTVVEELTKDKCDGSTDKTEKIRNADSSLLESLPSTSSTKLEDSRKRFEEMIAKKEERLKRLESQAESLVNITANTASRSVEICNKLDDLHEAFGQSTDHQESRRSRENEENVTGEESTKVNEDSNSSVDDSDGGDK